MFIQNRAKSIAQKLNAKNIAPLNRRIYDLRDKIAESSARFDDIISINAKFKKSSADSANSQNLGENSEKNAEFTLFGGLESRVLERNSSFCESKKKQKLLKVLCEAPKTRPLVTNPHKSFCYFWLLPNEESPLHLNPNLPNNADSANNALLSTLKSLLLDLKPWRKGPFNICGIEVQSEWDSAIKFNIIAPHLSVEGKVIADIGCNNGYYSFRLLPLRPSKIVCFEPSAHCKMQFDLINAFVRSEICFEMLGVEDLAEYDCKFDCILCLGVIYHRTNPLDCLRILKNALNPRGELIIDTLIIEGQSEIALSPLSYAKMKNVYFIPSISAFKNWLVRAGFREIELLCVKKTTSEEQRKTAWSGGESLEDFLDKEDKNKTIEGYSAPIRAYFKAKI